MLVLTRKTDEQILIGENIKITLVRVRGNSVRIGIDAPRDVRIVRGELDPLDGNKSDGGEFELSDREQVFAHPQAKVISGRVKLPESRHPKSALSRPHISERPSSGGTHPIVQSSCLPTFVGRPRRGGDDGKPAGPLAGFVSAK